MILNIKLITGEGLTFKVDKSSCVIGRSAQADVVIPHEAISRKHCQIEYRDGDLYVTDLGSINGVILDGQKIPPNKPVKFQSFFSLSFGAVQSLNVELEEEHTSVQQNPLLAPSLQLDRPKEVRKPQKTTMMKKPDPNAATKKMAAGEQESLPMTNFIALCVVILLGFIYFLFQDEISSLF
jgi:pSer/pThr/pTyr-binding forkhead associated (FHA) protein